MKLISINGGLIVHPLEILRAERCGNYTHVYIRDRQSAQIIWDEHSILWEAIRQNASEAPEHKERH